MIFGLGVFSVSCSCLKCGREHSNVQVGEERVICACGSLIVLKIQDAKVVEVHYSAEYCASVSERFIDDDKRNLC